MELLRDKINQWFDRHEVAWELFMSLMVLVFIGLSFLPGHPLAVTVDVVISLGFVAEFTVRLAASRSRRLYLLHHWMDVVALIPVLPLYRDTPWARAFRLLRLLMALRLLGALDRVTHHVTGVTAQPGLTYLVVLILLLVFSAAGIVYLAEGSSPPGAERNEELDSYTKALYSALLNVATESGAQPRTGLGKSMVLLLMFGGLILSSLLTASIITYLNELIKAGQKRHNPAVEDVKARLDRLDDLHADELRSLRGAVLAIIDHRISQAPPSQIAPTPQDRG